MTYGTPTELDDLEADYVVTLGEAYKHAKNHAVDCQAEVLNYISQGKSPRADVYKNLLKKRRLAEDAVFEAYERWAPGY